MVVGIGSAASGAPTDAQYVVLAANATLTQERVLTGSLNEIVITDGGAGGAVTLSAGSLIVQTDQANTWTTGSQIIQTAVDTTTAFQVFDADGGAPVLSVDTVSERVGIGIAAPGAKLDIGGAHGVYDVVISRGGTRVADVYKNNASALVIDSVAAAGTLAGFVFNGDMTVNPATHPDRLIINGESNVGFRLQIGGVNKWSNAVYVPAGVNHSYVLYNDQTLTNAWYISGDTNNVGIGHLTPGGKVHIQTGTAATVGFIVQGAAAQTANLTNWETSAGTSLLEVEASGELDFRWAMGNSTKDPTTDAPADWVQVKIGGTSYYLPAYAAS